MPWTLIAAAVVSAVSAAASAYSSYSSNKAANENADAWNAYNTYSNYATNNYNSMMQLSIARFNAAMQAQSGEMQAKSIRTMAETNALIIDKTAEYNDSLLAEEERQLWNSWELDDMLYAISRKSERGVIESVQSASGTLMGQGSNADVVSSQMAQEMLDRFAMKQDADIKASDILNSRLENMYSSDLEIKKVMWEGEMNALAARSNGSLNAVGTLGNAILGGTAAATTNNMQRLANTYSAAIQYDANINQNKAALVSGLFGAATQAASSYFASQSSVGSTGATGTTDATSTVSGNNAGTWLSANRGNLIYGTGGSTSSISTAGSSLLGAD